MVTFTLRLYLTGHRLYCSTHTGSILCSVLLNITRTRLALGVTHTEYNCYNKNKQKHNKILAHFVQQNSHSLNSEMMR